MNKDAELIAQAAQIIDEEALCLRMSCTKEPDHTDWGGEEDAQATYEEWKRVVDRLYKIAGRMGYRGA